MAELRGQIERITYSNPENGWTVAKLQTPDHADPVTVVGNLVSVGPGEILQMQGDWSVHPKYGSQFTVSTYDIEVPATITGIKKYLGSGLIKGIGPKTAERIVEIFGESTLDVIENQPKRLRRVEGIGDKRIDMIRAAWNEQKSIRDVMIFLQSNGAGAVFAAKVFRRYGADAIAVVRENPYRLAMDVHGIGFVTADKLAENLGIGKSAPVRVRAGVRYVLQRLSDEGHVYSPLPFLVERSQQILEVEAVEVEKAVNAEAAEGHIVVETLPAEDFTGEDRRAVYLSLFYTCERGIARLLSRLDQGDKSLRPFDVDRAIAWVQRRLGYPLSQNQEAALKTSLTAPSVHVVTGGPGVGKTTLIFALQEILLAAGGTVFMAAPTGRAAKRMSEATGRDAKTIHRLLEYSPQSGGFEKNAENPLACDVLIIDEASMIDAVLMYQLLRAIPPSARLVLVGDVNQLPSVGPGTVFGDIIHSEAFPVSRLTEIFRQAKESRIVTTAHKINQGHIPRFRDIPEPTDFYFIEKETPEEILDIILRLTAERIPARFGYNPQTDIQVLTPMQRGVLGAVNLNIQLQTRLNPEGTGVTRGGREYRTGDKVMQIRNNYEKAVFNGDIGRIQKIDPEWKELVVGYDDREVVYEFPELDEIAPAYAVTVHKSQGSEYPAVVMPLATQHYMLLQRNLLYTAITRGKALVVLVGQPKALALAVKNDKTRHRYSRLQHRLRPGADCIAT